jgi:hypothetical protein
MGVALRVMPYEFTDREYEPEAQASASRGGIPPRKITGVGVLDPPVPPKKQPGPLTPDPRFLAQARRRRDYSHWRGSYRGSPANPTLIATQRRHCESIRGLDGGVNSGESGGPERSRTSDNLVRSQVLYPAELQARRNNTCVPSRLRYPARDFNSLAHLRRRFSLASHSSAFICFNLWCL